MPTPHPAPEAPRHRGRLRTIPNDRTMQLLQAITDDDVDAAALHTLNDDYERYIKGPLASLPGLGAN